MMPELRRDPIVDRWVIVAENRAQRPGALTGASTAPSSAATAAIELCPFCPGNEAETPPEVFALRGGPPDPASRDWRVRVVPNKYPVFFRDLADQATLSSPHRNPTGERPLFESVAAVGVHEVIIDTPRHVATVGELSDDEFADSLLAIQIRLKALRGEGDVKHALAFKNVGRAAGATREHLHSQLIAGRLVPPLVAEELRGAWEFFRQNGECVFCRMITAELGMGLRIVGESVLFVALCPFAARFPYELWLLPKAHASHFESIGAAELADLANLARGAIARIETLSSPPAYNLVIHTSPFDTLSLEHYHWHMEVFPRLTIAAGFEWGSGCAVNPISPEAAARVLRQRLRKIAD